MAVVRVGREWNPEFPTGWMARLREESPVSAVHSYLVPVWYKAGQRWVLYDALPGHLIQPHLAYGTIMGQELLDRLEGAPPRLRFRNDQAREVSQVQYDLYQQYGAYCRPLLVLQGEHGGHQAEFTPQQQWLLSAQHLPMKPPPIGRDAYLKAWSQWKSEDNDPAMEPRYLHPCPFDGRVIRQLRGLNRLLQMQGNLDTLRKSRDASVRKQELDDLQREIRKAEMEAVAQFMTPVVDMASSLHTRSDARDHLIMMDGEGAKAQARLDYWMATGEYVLDPDHPPNL